MQDPRKYKRQIRRLKRRLQLQGEFSRPNLSNHQTLIDVFDDLAKSLEGVVTSKQAAEIAVETAEVLLGWDSCFVGLYDREAEKSYPLLTIDTIDGEKKEFGERYDQPQKPSETFLRVIREGPLLIHQQPEVIEKKKLSYFGDHSRPSLSLLFVPFTFQPGAVIGMMSIQSYTPEAYTDEDLKVLQVISSICASAIARTEAEEALLEIEQDYKLLYNNAMVGLFRLSGRSGRLLECNAYLAELFNYKDRHDCLFQFQIEERYEGYSQVWQKLRSKGEVDDFEAVMTKADGTPFWVRFSVKVLPGSGLLEGMIVDVTRRREAEERLRRIAYYDPLTGLPNRTYFMEELNRQAKDQPESTYAILFLDLDRFKNVNDSLGHQMGDTLLQSVSILLRKCIRDSDFLARLGGDEFTILMPDINRKSDPSEVAERILQMLTKPLQIDSHEIFTNASIGIATKSSQNDSPEEILRDADTAMYEAKKRGRGCFAIFDRVMHERVLGSLHMETMLRTAFRRGYLHMEYQPVYTPDGERIVGVESLIRWNDPSGQSYKPDDFIPLAEDTGLITPISEWVISEVVRDIESWRSKLGEINVTVGINISGRHLVQPNFVKFIKKILKFTSIPIGCIALEITENVIFEDPIHVNTILGELKELGVKLHLDDFGTGFSSLSYLHQFPIDALKIDRSFVMKLQETEKNREIVRSVLALGDVLDIEVIAEGVETEKQLEILRQLGSPNIQGFLFGKSRPSNEILELIKNNPPIETSCEYQI